MNGKNPNKAEQAYLDAISEIGCIACWVELGLFTPGEIHHPDGGSNHMAALCLCHKHHREGSNNALWVSRHPWRDEFIKRYGTEKELHEKTKELLEREI